MTEVVGPKTKIVCTIGPVSGDAGVLKRMVEAGMDVARINSGHCDFDEVRKYAETLDRIGQTAGRQIGVMLDLQGPRLRVGSIKGSSAVLGDGQEFTITTSQIRGDSHRVSVSYTGLPDDLEPGNTILIDDGLIRLKVKEINGTDTHCEVVEGGRLMQGKGMNFPGVKLDIPSFTDRDRRYLEVGLEVGVDWISQSFVREADDVKTLKDAIKELGHKVPVMAKIEKSEAVENISSILIAADGVMVARGDLGVEMNTEEIPLIQKEIIRDALHAARPVVTATQMLESMVEKPRPTRAEASDVANAILDGTDAVMLSAETAIGHFPIKAVETMVRIAQRTERAIDHERILEDRGKWAHRSAADSMGYAACRAAADLGASAIITITRSGYTAKLIARYRPAAPILAASPNREVVNGMALIWGVKGLVVPLANNLKGALDRVVAACVEAGMVEKGDRVVITGGFLDEKIGTTNMIHVHTVG